MSYVEGQIVWVHAPGNIYHDQPVRYLGEVDGLHRVIYGSRRSSTKPPWGKRAKVLLLYRSQIRTIEYDLVGARK